MVVHAVCCDPVSLIFITIAAHEPEFVHSLRALPGRNQCGVWCSFMAYTEGQMNRLIYKSRCNSIVDWDLINSILNSSTRNNRQHGITGVLIATETHFLQFLEGKFEPLNETFERISRDPRHNKIQIIEFSETQERRYGDWAMHGLGLFDFNYDQVIGLCLKYGENNGNVRFPDRPREALALLDELLLHGGIPA